MTCGNSISVPDAEDKTLFLHSAQDLPFFIVHRIQPDLSLRLLGDYVRHATFKRAQNEARRLARKFPGNRFVVLQACTWVVLKPEPDANP